MIQKIINNFLHSIKYSNTSIHYDMNAIKIRLHENNSDNRYLFLYLYAPWRITRNNTIVNSSDLYPLEYNYTSKEKHKKDFTKFCKSTNLLMKKKITEITINSNSNDLIVKWDNGAVLEKYCLDAKDYAYHIYDYLNNVTYDVYFNKIKRKTFKSELRPNQALKLTVASWVR